MQLPIEKILPELRSVFLQHHNVVLSADPGAGKTTRVPLALLNEPWLEGKKIIMLEPRRLAAKRASEFMSKQLGERVGETVGYRIRGDNKISPFLTSIKNSSSVNAGMCIILRFSKT